MATFTLAEQEYLREEISRQLQEVLKPLDELIQTLWDVLDGRTTPGESPLQELADRVTALERRLYAAGIR